MVKPPSDEESDTEGGSDEDIPLPDDDGDDIPLPDDDLDDIPLPDDGTVVEVMVGAPRVRCLTSCEVCNR